MRGRGVEVVHLPPGVVEDFSQLGGVVGGGVAVNLPGGGVVVRMGGTEGAARSTGPAVLPGMSLPEMLCKLDFAKMYKCANPKNMQ